MTNDEILQLIADSSCNNCLNPKQVSDVMVELLSRITKGIPVTVVSTPEVPSVVSVKDAVSGETALVADGHLSTLSIPMDFEIAHEGLYGLKKAYLFNVVGRRGQFNSTSVLQDVGEWLAGTIDLFPELTGVETLQIVSSSAQDNPAGTGTGSVKVTYLDNNNNMVTSPAIALNGLTAVPAGFAAKFIYWMEAFSGGSGEVSVGNIDLRTTPGNVIQERITAGGNKSLSARFMIPAGYHGFIPRWSAGAIGGATQDVRLRATTETTNRETGTRYLFQDNMFVSANARGYAELPYMEFKPLAKIKASTISSAAAAGNRIDCTFPVLIVQEP